MKKIYVNVEKDIQRVLLSAEIARRDPTVLSVLNGSLPAPMSPEVEQLFVPTIQNPHLLLADDLGVYRDHVRQNGHCYDKPELPKSIARAAKLRAEGNVLFVKKEYGNALFKYNESICAAPNDSQDLGIGYPNRSAVFYCLNDHLLVLANVALAKRHNYPERLMAKLLLREAKSQQAIDDPDNSKVKANPNKLSGSKLHSYLSDRICVRKLPIYNNSLVAKQDFKAGDVILLEKPLMASVDEQLMFVRCNHCSSENLFHLIPCPNCAMAMFCNEECQQDGHATHRLECGITGALSKLMIARLGSRMFFHGLALFDQDVDKLMRFCQRAKTTEHTFVGMDYLNYDPLKEFEMFLAVKPGKDSLEARGLNFMAAIVHAIVLKVSSVRALITNREQEDFMLTCFAEYMQKAITMSIQRSSLSGSVSVLYPMGSQCNHSCDPNALALGYGGRLKLIAMRPIRRDEQIFISYIQDATEEEREMTSLGFDCICELCDKTKAQKTENIRRPEGIAHKDWTRITSLLDDPEAGDADRMNALQQFVQRYASIHPREDFDSILKVYCTELKEKNALELDAAMRAKIAG